MAVSTDQTPRLTERQELFCIEYVLNGGNAAAAARRAGYSENSDDEIGYENLRKPQIIARIDELRKQSGVKTGANIEWLESMLVSAIERCAQKQQVYDSQGEPTGEWKFDSKGIAANANVLMRLKNWDKPQPEGGTVQPVRIVAVEGFTGWKTKE